MGDSWERAIGWGLVGLAAVSVVAALVEPRRRGVPADLSPELRRLWPMAEKLTPTRRLGELPKFTQRRGRGARTTGTAWYFDRPQRIAINVGHSDDAGGVLGTVAHEVAHLAAPPDTIHGPPFWGMLVQLVEQGHGVHVNLSGARNNFERQDRVEAAIRHKRRNR